MAFEYPTNYYQLRRVLSMRIKDKLEALKNGDEKFVDREEIIVELKIFARDLSNESGAPISLVYKLFTQYGVYLS